MGRKPVEKETPARSKKFWTEEEIEYLEESWGKYSAPSIAKKLNRTLCGVQQKAIKLGLGSSVANSDMVPFIDLLREFDIEKNYSSCYESFTKAGFKIYTFRNNTRFFNMIDLDEFWEFAEKNPHFFDFSKLELNALGKEPEWVKNVRREHYKQRVYKKNARSSWSEREIKELVRLTTVYHLPCVEIAARLNRTETAIIRKMIELKIKDPFYNKTEHAVWLPEELEAVEDMVVASKSYEAIGLALNRSANSIRSKLKRTYGTESLFKIKKILEEKNNNDNTRK